MALRVVLEATVILVYYYLIHERFFAAGNHSLGKRTIDFVLTTGVSFTHRLIFLDMNSIDVEANQSMPSKVDPFAHCFSFFSLAPMRNRLIRIAMIVHVVMVRSSKKLYRCSLSECFN